MNPWKKSVLWLCALPLAAAVGAGESIAPDWSQTRVLPHANQKQLAGPDNKPFARVSTEPKYDAVQAVDVAVDNGALVIDTTKAEAAGAKKVNLRLNTIAAKQFPDRRYTLTLAVQGPDKALGHFYFEGTTPDKKHFYKRQDVTLTGEKQVLVHTIELPDELAELHLRFDMLTPGVYRFTDATFGSDAPAAPAPAAATAAKTPAKAPVKEGLIFYAPFDGTAEAAVAGGKKGPVAATGLAYVPGLRGKAVRVDKKTHSILKYALDGNLVPEQGTIALWYRADEAGNIAAVENPYNRANWRALMSMPRPAKRLGSGALWLWLYGVQVRADTSDRADGHRATPEAVPPGVWTHVAFTWQGDDVRLYLNGREQNNTGDSRSPLRPKAARVYDRPTFDSFFVGGHGDAEQADGLIDEFRVYASPLSPDAIAKLVDEDRRIEVVPVSPRYVLSGPEYKFTAEVRLRKNEQQPITWQWFGPDGRPQDDKTGRTGHLMRPGSEVSVSKTVRTPEGKRFPGPYRLEVTAGDHVAGTSFWVLGADNPYEAPAGPLKTVPVETLRPTPGLSADRFLSIGENRMGSLDGRGYLEAGSDRGDRFAIRFQLPDGVGPYVIEWDYPDDKLRTCDIIAQPSKPAANVYELQVGYVTGNEYRNSNAMLTQRAVYWPRGRDMALVFMTARSGAPAAVAEIRIARVEGGLPAAPVVPAKPVDGHTRTVGIYYEDPAINYGFGAAGGAMPGLGIMIDRLAAYMKYSGQNLFAYPLVWYHGPIGPTYNPRNHADDFLEAFLVKFDAEGLEFMGTLNQNNMPFPDGVVTPESLADGSLHATAINIHATGKPNPGGWHGTPANFNILHPDVQAELFGNVDRILDTGAAHPSFKGLILHLPRHSMLWLSDIQAGYNDYAVEAFEKATGIKVPVDRKDALRGKRYADWILANARERWIDWRCQTLADIYARLAERIAARRPDLRLVVNSMIPVPEIGDPRYAKASDFVRIKNREAGIDPKYLAAIPNLVLDQTIYPADYRWREGRPMPEGVHERMRDIDAEASYYELLDRSATPWTHMHDRYWESAIGASNKKEHWSDKPNALVAPWFQEQGWRVSTLNPAGVHALRHYVLPLRYNDIQGMTKGGFLIGTYGMEDWLVPFAQAFRALPAKVFADVDTGSKTIKARWLEHDGFTWFYVVNTDDRPAEAVIGGVGGKAVDLVGGAALADPSTLKLGAYELRAFKVPGRVTVKVKAK